MTGFQIVDVKFRQRYLGAAFFQDSYLADAIREFRAALALRPDDPDARANLAAAWIRLGDPQDAIPELERLAALDANDRQVHSDLGLCYLESGRWSEAAREYTLLLKSDPGSPELLYNLAVTQKHLEDLAAARALLLKCLQLQPDFPAAELELGEALWQEGMLEEAAEHLRSLCAAHPDFLPAYFPLAEVLRQKGDVQGALAATQAVLKANPQSASAYQELAILEQQRGNVDAAAAAFHQAEELKNKSKVRQAAHVATGSALRLLRATYRDRPNIALALGLARRLHADGDRAGAAQVLTGVPPISFSTDEWALLRETALLAQECGAAAHALELWRALFASREFPRELRLAWLPEAIGCAAAAENTKQLSAWRSEFALLATPAAGATGK